MHTFFSPKVFHGSGQPHKRSPRRTMWRTLSSFTLDDEGTFCFLGGMIVVKTRVTTVNRVFGSNLLDKVSGAPGQFRKDLKRTI